MVVFSRIQKPQGEWDRVAEQMIRKFAEEDTLFSVLRVQCHEEHSRAMVEHFQYTSVLMEIRLTVSRTIISVYQRKICGAVSDLWEESKTCHVRTGRLVVGGQSDPLFVPSVMKTHF